MQTVEFLRDVPDVPLGEAYPNSILSYLSRGELEEVGCPSSLIGIREASSSNTKTAQLGGFWARQFDTHVTPQQKWFDVISTMLLPSICFLFDPFVFRELLIRASIFAHVGSYAAVMGLLAWLLWGKRLGACRAVLGGLFASAAFFSLVLGLILTPFSLLGIVAYFVGLFGFSPFLFSFSMYRNSVRAIRSAEEEAGSYRVEMLVTASALASAALPLSVQGWW